MEGKQKQPMRWGRSLAETPTWSVATVTIVLVAIGITVQCAIHHFRLWLQRTKRKPLLASLEKIKEELMLFGLLSLLLGHWTIWVAKICVKSSKLSTRFYPCSVEGEMAMKHMVMTDLYYSNHTVFRKQISRHNYCPEGREPFVSYESLEQLHRFLFVLGIIHVFYCCFTVAVAMAKIYSWRIWETQAKSTALQNLQGSPEDGNTNIIIRRQSTFIFHHTSNLWSNNKVVIWMLCFIRQFWRSINKADYMALRLGFITNHNLHLSYNFHSYMLRSMEEEFRDIVGISWLLWGYAIICISVNIHGTNIYFWLSFIPAVAILLIGTKLHYIVVKLALEVRESSSITETQFNLRDDLFWFGKPKLLLWMIQLVSFQNAFEMATYIWSLWEIKEPSCFLKNNAFLVIRLTSGIIVQFWCSYSTFPLYVIITQMGSNFKKALLTEDIRESLHGWRKRVKEKSKHDHSHMRLGTATSTTSFESVEDKMGEADNTSSSSPPTSFWTTAQRLSPQKQVPVLQTEISEQGQDDEESPVQLATGPVYDSYDDDNAGSNDGDRDESCLLHPL